MKDAYFLTYFTTSERIIPAFRAKALTSWMGFPSTSLVKRKKISITSKFQFSRVGVQMIVEILRYIVWKLVRDIKTFVSSLAHGKNCPGCLSSTPLVWEAELSREWSQSGQGYECALQCSPGLATVERCCQAMYRCHPATVCCCWCGLTGSNGVQHCRAAR